MHTLIANSGIQIAEFEMNLSKRKNMDMWFHEYIDESLNRCVLDIAQEVVTDTNRYLYKKKKLFDYGYLRGTTGRGDIEVSSLTSDGISPLCVDDEMRVAGDIYRLGFAELKRYMSLYEKQWLPLPYFKRVGASRFDFGPLNWCRVMFVPAEKKGKANDETLSYKAIVAFDTRTVSEQLAYNECPTFAGDYQSEIDLELCGEEFKIMDYCSPENQPGYVNDSLLAIKKLSPEFVEKNKGMQLEHIAAYVLLVRTLADSQILPSVRIYKDKNVPDVDVDMVVDIGNSKTTAVLIEDPSNFNDVSLLELLDFSSLVGLRGQKASIEKHIGSFDMRLAFRKVRFGNIGISDSKQFVYPSFVRLGEEANFLVHQVCADDFMVESLSTLSSPKRYLWDNKKSYLEWKFLTVKGENQNVAFNIPGISEYLNSDGSYNAEGRGGTSYYYSRCSLMTLAFLEMLSQAQMQLNSDKYREDRGQKSKPRHLRRLIVTCPTAISKVERDSLVRCAKDACKLYKEFYHHHLLIEVVPEPPRFLNDESQWYYDEATCAQLVYLYGEAGYKYNGSCEEFFNIYGKPKTDGEQASLTVGSIDIGAGTSDLMICNYKYKKGARTVISPEPLFYDSFYFAGDDMLNDMVKNLMFFSEHSALLQLFSGKSDGEYRQSLRNFFGPDYTGQTAADRRLRRDFNLQYSVPLMHHMLDLLSKDSKACVLRFKDVFESSSPNNQVRQGFKEKFGVELETLEWEYHPDEVYDVVKKSFEPLLKKIATIFYSQACDIVLLSGRPSSLSPIRDIFLKYYPVSPNRLILLNNYYVGHWYPFGNNTGYISVPKTIVAMGAVVAFYAKTLGVLSNFSIDTSLLDKKLQSVVNYVENPNESDSIKYLLTPQKSSEELILTKLPLAINIKQLDVPVYPSRTLYVVDFDRKKIGERIVKQSMKQNEFPSDNELMARVKEEIERLRYLMPFTVSVSQDAENKELLEVDSVEDKNGNVISNDVVKINVQSLGTEDNYWLDSGVFNIQ